MLVHYWINLNYYTEVLCENKDKPMMHCNGKCALSKELRKAEEGKAQTERNIPQLDKIKISHFIPSETPGYLCFSAEKGEKAGIAYTAPQSEFFRIPIDHPPAIG